MAEQNYNNHRRWHPLWHFVIYTAITILIIGSIINLYRAYTDGVGLYSASLIAFMSLILLGIAVFTRYFALRAQDRAIRAEENLRYFAITGNLLDSKLTMGQIIALRFAPNNELLDLAHKALQEHLSPNEIKKAIQNWKADHNRV